MEMISLEIYHFRVNHRFEMLSDILFLIASKIHKSLPSFHFSNTNMYLAYCRNIVAKSTNINHKISNHIMIPLSSISTANSLDVVVINVNSPNDRASQLNSNIKKKSLIHWLNDLDILLSFSFTKWIHADNQIGYMIRYHIANIINIVIINHRWLLIAPSLIVLNNDHTSIPLSSL